MKTAKTISCILISIFAVLLSAPTLLPAQEVDLLSFPGAEKIQDQLIDRMLQAGEIRRANPGEGEPKTYNIIVNMRLQQEEDAQMMDYRSTAGLERIQGYIKAVQDTILVASTQGVLKVLHRYQNIPGFSAEADATAILDLVQLDEVAFIEEQPVFFKMSPESHPLTHVDAVHRAGFTGEGVTIAIIDDGIAHRHAAFGGSSDWPNAKILGGHDFADHDNDPRIDCPAQSHGTAVAGVAAGNGVGVTGTAPDAKLVVLKVQSAEICGQERFDGDVAAAIDWAVSNRNTFDIKIISMSLGSRAFQDMASCDNVSVTYRHVMQAAHAAGMIVLAAAGNDGFSSRISFPACLTNVISVGATYDADIGPVSFFPCTDDFTDTDLITCYSNSAVFLDILAPSHCALTARVAGDTTNCFGGTSSATPFVAGVVATLLQASKGALDNDQVRSLITSTGTLILDPRNGLMTPRIDAAAALKALLNQS